jgi:hypothetical protein
VIRIAITAAAFDAIAHNDVGGTLVVEPEIDVKGERQIGSNR